MKTQFTSRIGLLALVMLLLVACEATPTLPPTPPGGGNVSTGEAVPTGEVVVGQAVKAGDPTPVVAEITIEQVCNCDVIKGTMTKEVEQSHTAAHAVQWQIGGEVGVGAEVSAGVVALNISEALSATYGEQWESSKTYSVGFPLTAEAGTKMEYVIEWRELWEPGYIPVETLSGEESVEYLYLVRIEADIIASEDLGCKQGCDGVVTRPPTDTPETELPPTDTPETEPPLPPDLTGRLAIPVMYGNEPKVCIVSTRGELQGIVGAARQPDYTRDGTKLVVNGDWGEWNKLRVLDPIGNSPFEIGDPALAGHSHPAWSPNGTQVIYDDNTVDPRGWRIFIRDLNTNGPGTGPGTMLRAGAGTGQIIGQNPVWASQDRFVFRGCDTWSSNEWDCGIWVMQGNVGMPIKLTSSPDHIPTDVHGDTVVYVSAKEGNWDVYTLNIVTGSMKQITFGEASDGLPTISPDGRSVAFLSDGEGDLSVWYVDIDGGTPKKLFSLSGVAAECGQVRSDSWSEEKLSWGSD